MKRLLMFISRRIKKVVYILCPSHKKCAKKVWNMSYPSCKFRLCTMQDMRSVITAYKETMGEM